MAIKAELFRVDYAAGCDYCGDGRGTEIYTDIDAARLFIGDNEQEGDYAYLVLRRATETYGGRVFFGETISASFQIGSGYLGVDDVMTLLAQYDVPTDDSLEEMINKAVDSLEERTDITFRDYVATVAMEDDHVWRIIVIKSKI